MSVKTKNYILSRQSLVMVFLCSIIRIVPAVFGVLK